ncbi:MAG: glycoside hydrolase family 3 protein [Oscillospiraceae bacterium]|nr:glycoside hydrolase family 3 protein [Oscillospiraceae bacterium]
MSRLIAALLCLALVLTGCAGSPPAETTCPPEPTSLPTQPPETTPPPTLAESILAGMTLREKVGQLFVVNPEALAPEQGTVTAFSGELEQGLRTYPVGGIILFAGNIVDSEQLQTLNAAFAQAGRIPMFLSVDEEGGRVARLANHSRFNLPRYESARAVGDTGDPAKAHEMGSTIGSYLRRHGFNLDFAPVADVATNPRNQVIGARAFSSDPEQAAQMVQAAARGLRERGIIPTYKHFPGHGDTSEDSHSRLAVNWKTADQLRACEWLPFAGAGPEDMVMVGHIAVPDLTGDRTPATMSRLLVTDILKGELGFQGLVITDSLQMGAITDSYSPGEAAVKALAAGCDLLLMPEDLEEAFQAVIDALAEGELDEQELNETVLRILEFKIAAGIIPEDIK